MDNSQQNNNDLSNPERSPYTQHQFKKLFEDSPISIWVEDFSHLITALEELKKEGINNFRNYLLSNPEILASLAEKINIVNVNKATLDLFEAETKDELIGSFAKIYSPSNSEIFINELIAIWNGDEKFSTEYRSLSLKGNPLFTNLEFRIPKNPIEFGNVFINIIDLTKLKSIENELLSKQELYKSIFTFAPSGILIENKDGIILDANDAQHNSLGYKKGELIGKNIRVITSNENKFAVEENISKIMSGEILIHELESIKKDGSRCINSLMETRIPLPDGEFGILNISTDVTEERKMREVLEKREEIFSSLFNYSSDILIVSDPRKSKIPEIVNINKIALQKYGYSQDEILGKPVSLIASENDKLESRLQKIMRGEIISFETEHVRKDGSVFPVEVTAKVISLYGKKNIFVVARDISELKVKEIQRKQKILFLEATSNISEIILSEDNVFNLLVSMITVIGETLNLDRTFIYDININENVAKMMTVWNNPNSAGLIHVDEKFDLEKFEQPVKFMLENKCILESHYNKRHPSFQQDIGKVIHEEYKIKTIVWVPFSFSPEKFLLLALNQTKFEREFTEMEMDFISSVTQQINLAIMKIGFLNKQIEQRSELKKLSNAVEQSPTEVIITNIDGIIEYVNNKFIETTGYTLEEVRGKTPRILKSGYTPHEEYEKLWNTITAGDTWRGEFKNKKKNGELYWESAVISPIKGDDGKIQYFLSIKEIITEKKKLLKELEIANIKAEKISQLKSSFLSQMSHEIRTPINTIISFSDLMRDDLEGSMSEDLEKSFDAIQRAGRRIIRTTELLLNLSEIQTDIYEPNFKMIELNIEILGPIALEYKQQASNLNLKFEYKIQTEEANVKGDLPSLQKIFINLIENAIKFTSSGVVGLRVFRNDENRVAVEISDTGVGISENFLPNIYDAFSQEETGYSRKYDGNGIGLTLVREYCKLNKINIEVKSKKGEGTKFLLVF